MEILDHIPFSLDARSLMAPLRIEPGGDDARDFQVCHREGCPNRRAEFNAALWDEIHNC